MFAQVRSRVSGTNMPAVNPAMPAMPATFVFPFYPPQVYSHESDVPNISSSLGHKQHAPLLSVFLKNLDELYGDGEYTCFEKRFNEEKFTVPLIKHLSDAQLIDLGVEQIGCRVALKVEADKYI